jgi:integrase
MVQRLARHSDIKLTTNTYTQVDDDEMRRAIEGKK